MLSPNKRTISVILERLKPETKGSEGDTGLSPDDAKKEMLEHFTDYDADKEAPDTEAEDACVAAAETILDAFKSNNPIALHEALKDYLELAKSY